LLQQNFWLKKQKKNVVPNFVAVTKLLFSVKRGGKKLCLEIVKGKKTPLEVATAST